jgi:type VI secretion system secreted protein Hcp
MDNEAPPRAPRHLIRRRVMAWGGALALVGAVAVSLSAAATVRPHALSAGSDTYITIAGVTGEGSSVGGTGTIEISSFSWGVSNVSATASGAGAGTGKVKVSSVTITKQVDSTSPLLFAACVKGTHYATVTLAVRKAGGSPGLAAGDSMQIVLSNAFVSSYSMSGGGGDEVPTESITLNFTKVQMQYTPQSSATVSAGWNLGTSKSF